jgi:hypothetical protein
MKKKIYTIEGRLDNHRVVEWDVSEINEEKGRLRITRRKPGCKITASRAISDEGSAWWMDRETAQVKADEINEEYALKPGQVRCRYCRRGVDEDKAVMKRIFSRNWRYQGGRSNPRLYCSSRCAGNDQMAHEG